MPGADQIVAGGVFFASRRARTLLLVDILMRGVSRNVDVAAVERWSKWRGGLEGGKQVLFVVMR